MAMATTKALIGIEEYLRTSYPEIDCEYVDGEIFEKPMPPKSHSRVQARLIILFHEFRKAAPFSALPELRSRTDETRVRIPDVAVYIGEPEEEVPSTPPYVAVEILSPDDKAQYLMAKLKEYRAWGAAHIWVINPADQSLSIFGSDGLREVPVLPLPEYNLQVTHEDLFPQA